jgi:hypothetical protein
MFVAVCRTAGSWRLKPRASQQVTAGPSGAFSPHGPAARPGATWRPLELGHYRPNLLDYPITFLYLRFLRQFQRS